MMKKETQIYVVTVKSCQVSKNNSEDITDVKHGVLHIFAHQEDALRYINDYYDKLEAEYKYIDIHKNSKGGFSIVMHSETTNPKGAISFNGTALGERIQHDDIECHNMRISDTLDADINIEDDYYDAFYG